MVLAQIMKSREEERVESIDNKLFFERLGKAVSLPGVVLCNLRICGLTLQLLVSHPTFSLVSASMLVIYVPLP